MDAKVVYRKLSAIDRDDIQTQLLRLMRELEEAGLSVAPRHIRSAINALIENR